MLYRIVPFTGIAGRAAVLPEGKVVPPVPGNTGLLVMEIVGFPTPFPLVTLIWSEVPVIATPPSVDPFCTATKPVPPKLAIAAAKPVKANVGLPATPLPSETDRPAPDVERVLAVTVVDVFFTTMPVEAVSRLPEVPFRVSR